jgi:hypothetical protein
LHLGQCGQTGDALDRDQSHMAVVKKATRIEVEASAFQNISNVPQTFISGPPR